MGGANDKLEANNGGAIAEYVRTAQQRINRLLGEDFEKVDHGEQKKRLITAYEELKKQDVPFYWVLETRSSVDRLENFTINELDKLFAKHRLDLRSIAVADKEREKEDEEDWPPGTII